MSEQHIARAFDRDLEAVQSLVLRMGGLVEEAITNAAKALEEGDLELADSVRKGDKQIDRLEHEINEAAARLIALRAPVSADLRLVLAAMRLSAGLERVGDYAKNIAKRTSVLEGTQNVAGTGAALRRMCREVQLMLKDMLDSFVRRDAVLAEKVRQTDQDVDQMYTSLFREFLTFMMEDPRNITPCMHLHFIAKNIERIGDLITNMAEQVIYMVKGETPDTDRVKADLTTKPGADE